MVVAIDFKASFLEGMNGVQALEGSFGPALAQLIKAYEIEVGISRGGDDSGTAVKVKRQDGDCISLELHRGESA